MHQTDLFAASVTLDDVLAEVAARSMKGHPRFYKPLPPDWSATARRYYESRLELPLAGQPGIEFRTPRGTVIAVGYNRIVVGDYGPYIEYTPEQIRAATLRDRFAGPPTRPVKYIWLSPRDGSDVKVYRQERTVSYADYVPGMYYIAPHEVRWAAPTPHAGPAAPA